MDYTYIVSYLKQSTFISFSRSLQGSPDLGPCYKILVFEGLALAVLITPSHHPIQNSPRLAAIITSPRLCSPRDTQEHHDDTKRSLSIPPRQSSATAHAFKNEAKSRYTHDHAGRRLLSCAVSGLRSNKAQRKCECQMRIDDFKKSTEDGVPQRLLRLPPGELERPQVIHGQNAPSLHTTNQSETGGSSRDSSVAPPTSIRSSETPEPYSSVVLGSRPRHRCHISTHEAPSDCTGRTGNGTAPPLTGSPSSCISDSSVLDGIGDKAFNKSMQLPQEDGTVRTSLPQQTPFLECQWSRMTGCKKVFPVSDSKKWITHTIKVHFLKKEGRRGPTYISPPTSNTCVFCEAKFQADSGDLSWSNMMAHVKVHYMLGHRLARIDWSLVEYLWEKGLLTQAEYRELKPIWNAQDIPSPPGLSDDEDPIALVEERRHRGGQ